MTTFLALSMVLLLLMIAVGGKRGGKSFFAMYINITILIITVILLYYKVNPLYLAVIVSLVISAFNLYFVNGINLKTHAAFLSVIVITCLLFVLALIFTNHLAVQGFSPEEGDEISSYSLYIGLNFYRITIFIIVIAAIGAILDTTISIASFIYEFGQINSKIPFTELYQSGLKVGKGVLAATTTTLFYAYLGSYLTLIVWFAGLKYSFFEIINSKAFAFEIISTFIGGIGIVLSVPLTAYITTYLLKRKNHQ